MTLIEAQKKLLDLQLPLFQTQDACACLKVNISHASKILERLEKSGFIKKIARGKWMLFTVKDPILLPEFLTAPYQSYISLQTALFYYGIISQIPSVTYTVSLARTQRIKTPLGVISIHHIDPSFFFGYQLIEGTFVKIATPEKALLDVFYLTPTKSRLFTALPELEIPKNFNVKLANEMIKKIRSTSLKALVKKRLDAALVKRY